MMEKLKWRKTSKCHSLITGPFYYIFIFQQEFFSNRYYTQKTSPYCVCANALEDLRVTKIFSHTISFWLHVLYNAEPALIWSQNWHNIVYNHIFGPLDESFRASLTQFCRNICKKKIQQSSKLHRIFLPLVASTASVNFFTGVCSDMLV